MSIDAFKEGLVELYQGELLGEVLFEALLGVYVEPEQQAKLASLLQLETETKARLRPVLMELGLSLTEQDDSRKQGLDLAVTLGGLTWDQTMGAICDTLPPVVERYQQIAEAAPDKYRALADSMVVHEQSLVDFAKLELAGEGDRSLAGVTAQLQFRILDT